MKDIFFYLKEHINIVDVVSHYVALNQIGNYYKGLSPFKNEKTASFTVTPDKKIFYCFSTHIGGDVVDFISRVENCSQIEAAHFLIEKYGITLPYEYKIQGANESDDREVYFKVYKAFISWSQEQLYQNPYVLDYLYNRGLLDSTISRYFIGYCPSYSHSNDFILYCKKNNLLMDDIMRTDLIHKKNKTFYLHPSDRIIFPIKNTMDLFCGYGGRIIKSGDIRAKYVNTANNEFFIKKNIVYGFSEARESMKKEQSVYIVEGYMDTLMMVQAGYKNTVATMGTAMTGYHVNQIKKFVTSVDIVYDGDEAGRRAVLRSISLFWNESIDVNIVPLPSKEDPASLCRDGKMEGYIHKKLPAISFFLMHQKEKIIGNNLQDIVASLKDILEIIITIQDEIKRMAIIFKISEELSIPKEFFLSLFEKWGREKEYGLKANGRKLKEKEPGKKKLIITNNEDRVEKHTWYLFFYLTLHFYQDAIFPIERLILLFSEFGVSILGILLKQYKTDKIQMSFLDFLKNNNEKIYHHCLKYMAMSNFSHQQYKIIYNKIINISWKIYKNQKKNVIFQDFLAYIG